MPDRSHVCVKVGMQVAKEVMVVEYSRCSHDKSANKQGNESKLVSEQFIRLYLAKGP